MPDQSARATVCSPQWPALQGLAVAFLFCLSAWPVRADVAQEDTLLGLARSADERGSTEVMKLEPRALASDGADATRQDDRLMLRLASGTRLTLRNGPDCKTLDPVNCTGFSLIVHARSRGIFLLLKYHYESAEFVLVDDHSGRQTSIDGMPTFSPSGNRFLEFVDDEDVGLGIRIWRRVGRSFVQEWFGSPHTGAMSTDYKFIGWPTEDNVLIGAKADFTWPRPTVTTRFSLRRSVQGWRVVDGPAPAK